MVIRVLASAPTQDEHSAINQQSKKSEVAWRHRQAKAVLFARANCSRAAHASSPPPDEFGVVNAPRLKSIGYAFSANGAAFNSSVGQRPRMHERFHHISAEGAIHFWLTLRRDQQLPIESHFQPRKLSGLPQAERNVAPSVLNTNCRRMHSFESYRRHAAIPRDVIAAILCTILCRRK